MSKQHVMCPIHCNCPTHCDSDIACTSLKVKVESLTSATACYGQNAIS